MPDIIDKGKDMDDGAQICRLTGTCQVIMVSCGQEINVNECYTQWQSGGTRAVDVRECQGAAEVCTKSAGRQDSEAKVSDSAPLEELPGQCAWSSFGTVPGLSAVQGQTPLIRAKRCQPLRSQEIILQGLLPKRGLGLLLALSRTLGADEQTSVQ